MRGIFRVYQAGFEQSTPTGANRVGRRCRLRRCDFRDFRSIQQVEGSEYSSRVARLNCYPLDMLEEGIVNRGPFRRGSLCDAFEKESSCGLMHPCSGVLQQGAKFAGIPCG
jgi:hypothetical protein